MGWKICKSDLYCFTVLLVKPNLHQILHKVCKAGNCFCALFVSRHPAIIMRWFRGWILLSLSPHLHAHTTALPALFLFASLSCSTSCSPYFWMLHRALSASRHSLPSKSFPNEDVSTVVPFLNIFCSPHLLESRGAKDQYFGHILP